MTRSARRSPSSPCRFGAPSCSSFPPAPDARSARSVRGLRGGVVVPSPAFFAGGDSRLCWSRGASLPWPWPRSSPEARDHEQRVVDAGRQDHPGHHINDEDREAELPGGQRSDAQAHDDGMQSHERRASSRRPGRRTPAAGSRWRSVARSPIPLLEVARRQGREVVPDRVVAGDGHLEPAAAGIAQPQATGPRGV